MGALLAVVPLPYRWLGLAALCAAFYFFAWYRGDMHGTEKLTEHIGKQATQAITVITRQGAATVRVVDRYIKVKGDTQVVTETITKEVVRYADANSGSCLDAQWGVLHDAASANTVPDPGLKPDAAAGAPTASTALKTITANYAACWRNANRLDALQGWVREQQAVR